MFKYVHTLHVMVIMVNKKLREIIRAQSYMTWFTF